ncbi:VC0807 family protein [Rhabdothermincola sp.]|uniref:VC0807 family protein n=1 Tax=Rhabdothermincola sp. TaxID=2820405 RepID=UPI002FDF471A
MAAFEIPRLRDLARHALPHLLEATLIPLVLFYAALWAMGVWAAILTGLAWSYGCIARRLIRRERVPGVLVLGSVGITTRFAVALATGSVFVFFLQPTLGTLLVAGAFLVSLPAGRPLAQKLAADFCPLPDHVLAHASVRRFFERITLLWAFVQVANAGATLLLLLTQPIGVFVVAKTATGWLLTGSGIAISATWFRRLVARHDLVPATA